MVSPDDLETIQEKIIETESRLTEKIGALPFRVSAKQSKKRREEVAINCPSCDSRIQFRMRVRKGGRKLVKCSTCNTHSKVLFPNDGEINVSAVPMHKFEGDCPACNETISSELPDYAGALISEECEQCGTKLIASRSREGVNIRTPKSAKTKVMPGKLIEAVREKLPQRPWPTYIHKTIAKELEVSNGTVTRIISHLIDKGEYPLPAKETEPDSAA